jgi:dTDP-glucose 4,6-dehydratase
MYTLKKSCRQIINNMNKKVVYITGCLGFIGSYVTRECLKLGWYVCGVDKITYAANPKLLAEFHDLYGDRFKFIHDDINNLTSLYDCDYVINLAAETHVDNSIVESKSFLHSNINGVHNLLELVKSKNKFKMPTLVHFSTDEVYGDITEGAHTESDLLKPSNPYSATKAAADMLVLAWARTFNVPYVIIRPTNNYGSGQYVEKLIPKTCKLLHLGKQIPLHNNGTPRRVWLHAQDTANAVISIISKNATNEIFNNYEAENIEIIRKLVYLIKHDDDINKYCDFTYSRDGQDLRYSLDDKKLRNIGWRNKINIDKILPSIVEYYKNNFIW